MSASNYIHLDDVIVRVVTAEAALLAIDDENEEWVPLSEIADGQ